MSLVRCLVPSLAFIALCAAEPATPPVTLTVADGSKLVKDWEASIYAKVWNDPAAAKLREAFAKALVEAKAESGIDPLELLTAAKGARLCFDGMAGPDKPIIRGSVDLGTLAAPALAILALRFNCVVVPVRIIRLKGAHFRMISEPPLPLPKTGDTLDRQWLNLQIRFA